ncbi:MAG: pantoate--beta-alanine ligase [Phycisphaerae bacterium]
MTTGNIDEPGGPPVVQTIPAVRQHVARARSVGRRVALVPTMGALHAGHISLIEAATASTAYTVVSIYVNPTQFGPREDLAAYPRTLDADRRACAEAGVDLIFAPTDAAMYPPGDQTRVRPGPLAEPMCGRFRPGHFEGVCTVVAKLFNIVRPDVAYFGQKDAQQAVVIRRMVEDLRLPVQVEVCPIVREPDGLAMSSRNAYLNADERLRALSLYRGLCAGRDLLLSGERSIGRVRERMASAVREAGGDVGIDYLVVVDPETLAPAEAKGRVLLAGAVRIGATRLIDNLLVDVDGGRA